MKHGITAVALSLVVPVAMAANPASTAYVDKKIAQVKASLTARLGHNVGSCYGGGVVFYVNPNPHAPAGQRGLIAAPTDVILDGNKEFVWDSYNTTGTNGTLVSGTQPGFFTGLANTKAIIGTSNGTPSLWPAAEAAVAYNTINPGPACYGETCTSWYLPSQSELNQLYLVASNAGETFWTDCGLTPPTVSVYWSSTQYDANQAWNVTFTNSAYDGYVLYGVTNNNPTSPHAAHYGVRTVRAF